MEVTNMNNLDNSVSRDLIVLEDETNPNSSQVNRIWPSTIIDQVFDQLSPTKKSLREIIKDLEQEIITGGVGNIIFPVASINGESGGDIIITASKIGLGKVDNTRDIDKPLSTPQRNTIMDILAGYNFKINLDNVYSHISDSNNPHSVNISQINKDDELTTFVNRLIANHSLSTERVVHLDIRNSLNKLWNYVDENINGGLDTRINNVLGVMTSHLNDVSAHHELFKTKEDIANKSVGFTVVTGDHIKYPSTRAVVEFVHERINTFKNTLPNIKDYVIDIKTVENRNSLPTPNEATMNMAYIIRTGNGSQNEIAICRKNPDNTYTWNISSLGSVSKFNSNHFEDSTSGLSIKMSSVIDAILTETGDMDSTVSNILKDYYTKNEVDSKFIKSLTILPGTMDGHIRYYINGDMLTMSSDISIPGLKNLAYMESISENEIRELAVQNRHLGNRSVDGRVIKLRSIKKEHIDDSDVIYSIDSLRTPKGTMLGNIMNDNGTVHSVNLTQLGDLLRPIIGGWPNINIPGVDSPLLEISPSVWVPNEEITFVDGSCGTRFLGTVSVLPNAPTTNVLSTLITSEKYQILDAGGWWRSDSDSKVDSLLGGSNVPSNTFAEVKMSKYQLEFSTLSIGNRVNAPYDIWVRYMPRPTGQQ
jgi:hypothetical protein